MDENLKLVQQWLKEECKDKTVLAWYMDHNESCLISIGGVEVPDYAEWGYESGYENYIYFINANGEEEWAGDLDNAYEDEMFLKKIADFDEFKQFAGTL